MRDRREAMDCYLEGLEGATGDAPWRYLGLKFFAAYLGASGYLDPNRAPASSVITGDALLWFDTWSCFRWLGGCLLVVACGARWREGGGGISGNGGVAGGCQGSHQAHEQ